MTRKAFALTAFTMLAGLAFNAYGAPINHGDFDDIPPGVILYTDVTESSATHPLPPARFGAPSVINNFLDFDPKEFVATAASGAIDLMDVQLNFGIDVPSSGSDVAGGMTSLLLRERGDFSLFGSGTSSTQAAAALSVHVNVFEVDGIAVVPFTVAASVQTNRDLPSSPGLLQPFSMGLLLDFGPALLNNVADFQFGVTGAEVVINNQLLAISEPGSVSFISKKDFSIDATDMINDNFMSAVPIPPSVWLFVSGLLGLAGISRSNK